MNAPSVWIIDDDRSIRWVLERAMTQAGMEVRAFEGGAEAVAQVGGLAHIQHFTRCVTHQVDAGPGGRGP